MSWTGYSDSGYTELNSAIVTNKTKILEILNEFVDIDKAIEECWVGEDATLYREELTKLIEETKTAINDIYDALARQCEITYQDWISKQSTN